MEKNEFQEFADFEVEKKQEGISHDTRWQVKITDELTGKEVITYSGCLGGVFIVHQDKEHEQNPGGTRQGVFGELGSIMVCYFKVKNSLRQTLVKFMGEEKLSELEKLDPTK